MLDHYILTYSTNGIRVTKIIIAQEQTIVSGSTNVTYPVRLATPSPMAMSANTPGSTTNSTNETVVTKKSSNKGGQSKGSTSSAAKARHIAIADATNKCAIEIAYLKALAL
jgi:hypothetical protein